jgi:hypothetical protein
MTGAGGYQNDATFGSVERNKIYKKKKGKRGKRKKKKITKKIKVPVYSARQNKGKPHRTQTRESRVLSRSWATYM